ncbi:hypothetical protein [Hydrogenophaga sp.]|uniref:hypothetical protein n=1 Tax=Hydrogenophaga sp. TaxID=1904254 RepID=UPI002FCB7C5D
MSTLKLDTLSNALGTKTVPSETVVEGSAKAWVLFSQIGTQTIDSAFNVSSITDLGAGLTRINFLNPVLSSSYAAALSGKDTGVGANFVAEVLGGARSTTQFDVGGWAYTGARADLSHVSVIVFHHQQ